MTVLAFHHLKGGVGKTSAAVNLAALAAAAGWRTVVWDLDVQGAATFLLGVEPGLKGGLEKLLRKGTKVEKRVRPTGRPRLRVLPADASLRDLDRLLDRSSGKAGKGGKKKGLGRVTQALDADVVVLDCPAGLGRGMEAVYRLADAVLVPVVPSTLAARSLDAVRAFAAEAGAKRTSVWAFGSLVDRRKGLHRITLQSWGHDRQVLSSTVPSASAVERMGADGRLAVDLPQSPAARAYRALWGEAAERLGLEDVQAWA